MTAAPQRHSSPGQDKVGQKGLICCRYAEAANSWNRISSLPRAAAQDAVKDQESVSMVMSSTNSDAENITRPWPMPETIRKGLLTGELAIRQRRSGPVTTSGNGA
jgi:hypothetical protein